jgi:hypothetical protein
MQVLNSKTPERYTVISFLRLYLLSLVDRAKSQVSFTFVILWTIAIPSALRHVLAIQY